MADAQIFKYYRPFPICPRTSLTDYTDHQDGQYANVNPVIADFVACSLEDLMDVFWNIEKFTITTSGITIGGRAFSGTFDSALAYAKNGVATRFDSGAFYSGDSYVTSYELEKPRGEPRERVCASSFMGFRIANAGNYPSYKFLTLSAAYVSSQWYLGYSFCIYNDALYSVSNPSAANSIFTSNPTVPVVSSGTFNLGNITLDWQGRQFFYPGVAPQITGATTTRYTYV
jgi:hypothetical protein